MRENFAERKLHDGMPVINRVERWSALKAAASQHRAALPGERRPFHHTFSAVGGGDDALEKASLIPQNECSTMNHRAVDTGRG